MRTVTVAPKKAVGSAARRSGQPRDLENREFTHRNGRAAAPVRSDEIVDGDIAPSSAVEDFPAAAR